MRDYLAALSGLTTRGRCFLAAGVVLALGAVGVGEEALLRAGVLLILLPLLSAATVSRTRVQLTTARTVEPARVHAGEPSVVTVALRNESRLPTGRLSVEDRVPFSLGSSPRFTVSRLASRGRALVRYSVQAELRGRYPIGPVAVRLTDPFGLVAATRADTARVELVVSPRPVPLRAPVAAGDRTAGGESRRRSVAAAGQDDIAVREYRRGDDLRRIHWRSTAHTGELMVRREEQPWQQRAGLLLDRRAKAHRGEGPASSFEWAVVAAASAGSALAAAGYSLRLADDLGGALQTGNQAALEVADPSGAHALLLDALAVVDLTGAPSLAPGAARLRANGVPGLVLAVTGALEAEDVVALARLRRGGTEGALLLLATHTWSRLAGHAVADAEARLAEQVQALRCAGWHVRVVRHGDDVGAAWTALWPHSGDRMSEPVR